MALIRKKLGSGGLGAVSVSLMATLSFSAAERVLANQLDSVGEVVIDDRPIGPLLLVDGRTENVYANTPPDSYDVINAGRLNVYEGATVNYVNATNGGVITVQGGADSRVVVNEKISIQSSIAQIDRATILGNSKSGEALVVARIGGSLGSQVQVSNSIIRGGDHGYGVGINISRSVLNLSHSTVYGGTGGTMGAGIIVAAGSAHITGSSVSGESNGLWMISDSPAGSPKEYHAVATIDNSTVQGRNGAAIKVGREAIADISIQNNSTLLSGNGNLLEVVDDSTANVVVDHSSLTGDLFADDTSTLNLTLQNRAQLTGNLINTNSVAINSGAQWTMAGDAQLKSLSMDGGRVDFGDAEGFSSLSLGQLSGSGTFKMSIDLLENDGDHLAVNGQADGQFLLDIQNTGQEPQSLEVTPLHVVHTEGGTAQFDVVGGSIDLGAYSYQLEQQGSDWFVVGSGKTISPSTKSVLALFNVAPSIWYSELSSLRSRMGEVRNSGEGGGWMRGYGNQLNVSTEAGFGYKQRQRGLSFGVDLPVPVSQGQLLVGVMGGYSKSDLNLDRGTAGTVDSFYVGAYGTWLLEEGYYLDVVAKINKLRNKADVAMTNGSKAKGDYDNSAFGASVEFGRTIKLEDDFFVEPYAQLSAVNVSGDRYRLDNGLEAKNNHTQSVLGKAGATLGRNFALADGGSVQPYVRAAFVHEFARKNDVKVNDSTFDNNLFGSRGELGAGVSAALSRSLQVHADLDYMKGDKIEQPWGVNLGLRYAF